MKLNIYVAVGIGGIIGSICRYSISVVFASVQGFPFGTLTANLIGCFVLTFLSYKLVLKNKISPVLFTAATTGIIGSFTTFSTFSVETIQLFSINQLLAIVYIISSLVGGLLFCYLGFISASGKLVKA